MAYDNITLGFAKDKDNNIVYIDKLTEEDRSRNFYCPVCSTEVKPVAINGITKNGDISQVTPHFSHYDSSKCNSESLKHWWYKNEFIKSGDVFKIKTDEIKEYICQDIIIEKTYKTSHGIYKPDLSIITSENEIIFVEFDYKNKKKIQDYIDKWSELKNSVISIDLKIISNSIEASIKDFEALYYEGKFFEFNKDTAYTSTIGKHKENIYSNGISEEKKKRISNLDWFWNDICLYNLGKKDIIDINNLLEYIRDVDENIEYGDKEVIIDVLRKPKCNHILKDIVDYRYNKMINILNNYKLKFNEFKFDIIIPRLLYDRIFGDYFIDTSKGNKYLKNDIKLEKWINDIYTVDKTFNNLSPIIEELNKKYETIFEDCSDIKNLYMNIDIYIPHYKDTVILKFGDNKFDLKKETKYNFIDNNSCKEIFIKFIEDKKLKLEFDKIVVDNLNTIVKIAKEKFEYWDDYYGSYIWKIESLLTYNTLQIIYKFKSTPSEEIVCNIEYFNNSLKIDGNIIDNNFDINNYQLLENIIIDNFTKAKKENVPLDNIVKEAIKDLEMRWYNSNYDCYKSIKVTLLSIKKAKVTYTCKEDVSVLYVINNNLYKNEHKLCSLINKSKKSIINIFNKLFNFQDYIDFMDLIDNEFYNFICKLNKFYSNLTLPWRIYNSNENNKNIIILFNKDNIIIDNFIIEDNNIDYDELEKNIKKQFSNSIHNYIYNKKEDINIG